MQLKEARIIMENAEVFNDSYYRIISGGYLDSLFTVAVNRVSIHPEASVFYANKDREAIKECLKIFILQSLGNSSNLLIPIQFNINVSLLIDQIPEDLLSGVCDVWEECLLAAVAECDHMFNAEVKGAWISALQPSMDHLRIYKN